MIMNVLFAICLLTLSPAGKLCEKAESLYFCGKMEEAMTTAAAAENIAVETMDTTSLIKAYCLQADIAIDCGNDLEAVDFYN